MILDKNPNYILYFNDCQCNASILFDETTSKKNILGKLNGLGFRMVRWLGGVRD